MSPKFPRHALVLVFVFCLTALLNPTVTSAQATPEPQRGEASVRDLTEYDPENDGITLPGIVSGDIIVRPFDGFSQIEAGQYLVPSNLIYVDGNGDGLLDNTPRLARVVVVMRDNLTYLFEPNTSNVKAVFANGIGKGGANTVVSVRVINVFLSESWGLEESLRESLPLYPDQTMPNYFGAKTIGTQFYLSDVWTVDTFQELHGTFRAHAGSVDGYNLLGSDVSGGCVRHRNEDILYLADNLALGELVLSIESAQDDMADNPLNIYNKTRLAAGHAPVPLPDGIIVESGNTLTRPSNFVPVMPTNLGPNGEIQTATWMNFDQVDYHPSFAIPEWLLRVEHPYARANYSQLTCGSETVYITSRIMGHDLLYATEQGFGLVVAPTITGPDGHPLSTSFYVPRFITEQEAQQYAVYTSSGDVRAGIFQLLVADFSYQYALYQMQTRWNFATPQETAVAVTQMSREQLRANQLVTGLIPLRYGDESIYPTPVGEWYAALSNRTVASALWNVFYGSHGTVYLLDYREPLEAQAIPHREMELSAPAVDNEFVATGEPATSVTALIDAAWANGQPVVLRVSKFRYLADASFALGMSAFHYYSLVDWVQQGSEKIAVVYDTMHPYDLLYIPADELAYVFTTMHIAPHQ